VTPLSRAWISFFFFRRASKDYKGGGKGLTSPLSSSLYSIQLESRRRMACPEGCHFLSWHKRRAAPRQKRLRYYQGRNHPLANRTEKLVVIQGTCDLRKEKGVREILFRKRMEHEGPGLWRPSPQLQ
jgi:hypothetical protein